VLGVHTEPGPTEPWSGSVRIERAGASAMVIRVTENLPPPGMTHDGGLSLERGARISAPLAVSSARACDQQSAAREPTHPACQRVPVARPRPGAPLAPPASTHTSGQPPATPRVGKTVSILVFVVNRRRRFRVSCTSSSPVHRWGMRKEITQVRFVMAEGSSIRHPPGLERPKTSFRRRESERCRQRLARGSPCLRTTP
jgi:hypothetical protein